ncbi:MAG: winged helix DNA-binding domain-containing protein [Proteobacteria bacterium]|nr:winged helix DNA-binding domain-containing protein [Pseudomonadota bacterium]
MRDIEKLGQSESVLHTLGDLICQALADGGKTTDALRAALSEDTTTSFGAAGKKLGVTTNLPPALRLLEWGGRIRRRQAHANLDNVYAWCLTREDPLALGVSPTDPVEQAMELARRFFAWASPASLSEFVAWYGGTKTNAKKAVAALGLTEVEVDGRACLADGMDPGSSADGLHFIPAQDNLLSLRESMALLTHPDHHQLQLLAMGSRTVELSKARWMHQRVVLEHGEVVGFWAWDRDAQDLVVAGLHRQLDAPAGLADFIRGPLGGEAKSNAIDGQKNQKQRVDAVRAMGR